MALVVAAGAAFPLQAADWTDANNATYTALRSIKGTATAIKTGGSWIVTDITPASNDTVKIRFKLNDSWTQNLWCARTNGSNGQFSGFYLSSTIRCDRNAKQKSGSTKPSTTGGDCTVVADYATGKFIIDGEYQSGTMNDGAEGEYQVGSTLMLFGSHEKGANLTAAIAAKDVNNRASYDLYYFQLYSSEGTLTHNLMPAVRDSDHEIGLYDTVTGSFYIKADNSGSFSSTAKAAVSGTPVKWTGHGGDNKMSNGANWVGGAVPVAGQDIDFTLATPLAVIDADINATFGKVWLSDVEKTTFTGTLTANEASDRAMINVAEGASVTILNAVTAATWTGAAGNGLFQDSNNWTCFNVLDNQVAGVPAADTAITLAADVPANGWADADFSEMSGSIDLAGHSLTVPRAFFDGATPAAKDVIVNGNFEADVVPPGATSLNAAPQGWTRSASSVIVTRNNTSCTYNNNKTDNGCYVAGTRNITQTFTLPEDAVLSLSFNRINRNDSKNTYYTSNGNVQIDGSQVRSWSGETGYGVKSYSVTVALAAGSHTIKFSVSSSNGSTFDNIKLTYQPSVRTVTDSVGGGELHVNVQDGETASNTDVNMTGHLKLVKEGAGVFVSQRTALTYDGGTEVVAGTLSTTDGAETDEVVNRTFGAVGNDITVRTGGTLLNGASGCDFPNYNVILDGGTLAAGAAGTLIETNGVCSVSTTANGGMIDNGGFAVTVAADIADAGALAFTGAGTTTLSVGQTASGALNVNEGTLALSGGVSVARPTTVSDGATLTVPGTESATFGSLTLAANSTLNLAAYIVDVTPLTAAELNLPESGAVNLTIYGGAFDAGLYAICANAGVTSSAGLKFVPLTEGLGCSWSVDDDTLFLTVGAIDPNTWTGSADDGDLSNPLNWHGGEVPTNGTAIINIGSPETLTVGTKFAPDAILFPLGCAALVIEGDGISGISAITNLSENTQTFTAPVAFADKILVIQNAVDWSTRAQSSVRFAGGVTGTDFAEGTARYLNGAYTLTAAEDWTANTQGHNDRWGIPEDSSLTLPFSSNTSELALGEHSTIAGGAFTAAVVRTSGRVSCWNLGEYVVTEELAVTLPDADGYISYRGSDGAYKLEKLTVGDTGTARKFWFANSANYYYTKNIWIGAGGITFAEGANADTRYVCGRDSQANDVVNIHPWHSDFTIGTKPGSTMDFCVNRATHIGTTDENGVARTVTADAIFYGASALHIEGAGRFVVNAVNTATGAVNVKDTATLAINEGKVSTSGTLTVNSGATLEVAESGTVTLAGNLTLASGANLAFNFTNGKNPPVLGIADGKTVTVNGAVTVKVTADGVTPSKRKVLTTCGGFDGSTVTLAEDAPDWAKGRLSVDADGNLVLDIPPQGTVITIR